MRWCIGGWVAVCAWVAGCAPADAEIVAQETPGRSVCVPDPAPPERELDRGTFDLVIGDRDSYLLTPRVANRTGSLLTIEAADVSFEWDQGSGPGPLSVRCEGGEVCSVWEQLGCDGVGCPVVPARDEGRIAIRVMPRVVTTFLLQRFEEAVIEGRAPPIYDLIATVTLRGVSAGEPVVTPPFEFPIQVCLGCLVEFPEGTDDPAIPGPDCCAGGVSLPTCLEGQDAPIDCRRCRGIYPELCNFGRPSCGG